MSRLRALLQRWSESARSVGQRHRMTIECEERLRRFDLPVPFNVEKLALAVEQVRGRPIFFVPWRKQGRPFGATFTFQERDSGEIVDIICYEELTPHSHQERIILHELAHLMCGHRSTGLFKHLDTGESVYGVLLRNTHSRPEEIMAETMAGLVRSNAHYQPLTDAEDPEMQEMIDRVARFHKHRMGRWRKG